MRNHEYSVYLLASKPHGTLYVGVTNDLIGRITEHREGLVPGFTKKYDMKMLVWFEQHGDIAEAIAREKKLKKWRRDWKANLIEHDNPHWIDLYPALIGHRSRTSRSSLRDDRSSGMTGRA
jgi:putative endonuclease